MFVRKLLIMAEEGCNYFYLLFFAWTKAYNGEQSIYII